MLHWYSADSTRIEWPRWSEQPVKTRFGGQSEKQQQCISRCSHVHCLPPHMGMFSVCLCPCVSRQDTLNYFAQLPPWTIATARQYTHHADTRTYSSGDHSSRPSHTWILLDTFQTEENRKIICCYGLVLWNFRLLRLSSEYFSILYTGG